MESIAPYDQDCQINQQQPTTSNQAIHQSTPQPSTARDNNTTIAPQIGSTSSNSNNNNQNAYQVKCSLLEYHIQEAVLVNKALRSELKQYKEKIDFEKKLRKFLVNRVKGLESQLDNVKATPNA